MTNHPNRSKRRYYVRCRRSASDRWCYAADGDPAWTLYPESARQFTLNDGRRFAATVKRGRPEWEVELEPLPYDGKRKARVKPPEDATEKHKAAIISACRAFMDSTNDALKEAGGRRASRQGWPGTLHMEAAIAAYRKEMGV